MTTTRALSEAQFSKANDKIDDMIRGTSRGTPERDAAEVISAEWEAAIALPVATKAQRDARHAVIAAVAEKHNLV